MVFTYFKRANFTADEFTAFNFFLALYLASDIEEDIEEYKYEIFPWALGSKWRTKFSDFLRKRDDLLRRIGYRAIVSRKSCEEVMHFIPEHFAWARERAENHGGAVRTYIVNRCRSILQREHQLEDDVMTMPRGPTESARPCPLCMMHRVAPALHSTATKYLSPSVASYVQFMPTPTLYASSSSSQLNGATVVPNSMSSSASFLRSTNNADDSASTSGYDTCSTTDTNRGGLSEHMLFAAGPMDMQPLPNSNVNNVYNPLMCFANDVHEQTYMNGMVTSANEIVIVDHNNNNVRAQDFNNGLTR
jgi:hypothetical protein